MELGFQVNNAGILVQVCPVKYLRQTYTKKVFFVYLKFSITGSPMLAFSNSGSPVFWGPGAFVSLMKRNWVLF